MTGAERIVVIGGGLAGLRTVEGLRSRGYAGRLTLVGAETEHPYDRPPLSKAVLKEGLGAPHLRASTDYADLDLDLRLGQGATSIDVDRRVVVLEGGAELAYDAAVVATGAIARPLPNVASPWLRTLRTSADSTALRQAMVQHDEIVIIGAGFLGCEVAATARGLGVDVTLIETQPTPLARVLGTEVGAELAELHRANGVDVRMGTALTGFASSDTGAAITFADGHVVRSKVVLVAIGALPATDWLAGSDLKVDDGILCDEFGRTSAAGVWAVGDSSSWWDPRASTHRRFEHWTNACDQADTVAANLVSAELTAFDKVRYFWSDQYDMKIQALGDPDPAELVEVLRLGPAERVVAVYGRDGIVTAVAGLGAPRPVMRTRERIATGVSILDTVAALRAM